MAFWHKFLKQQATYWGPVDPQSGWPPRFAFADPAQLSVLWFEKKQRFFNETDRASTEQIEVITVGPLAIGGVIALGAHPDADLADVLGLHEVMSTAATDTVSGDATLHQSKLRPVWGAMPESVSIYAMERVETARSYELRRGDLLYQGRASAVRQGNLAMTTEAGQFAAEWDVMISVPSTTALRGVMSVEIDWHSPHGNLVLHGTGGLWDSSWSPLVTGFACKAMKETA